MKQPNFFIVGGTRCGTTSLWEYLRAHQNIFMCEPKEPTYFASDFLPCLLQCPQTLTEYLALFTKATPKHFAVGEASTMYLFSSVAIANIYHFNNNARMIAMVRNPIEVAYSLFRFEAYHCNEDQPNFESAWYLQESRRQGLRIPEGCRAPHALQYASRAKFGQQVERLLTIFPQRQVKIIVFDDFIRSTKTIYEEVLSFLGVPGDARQTFSVYHQAKTYKVRSLWRFIELPPQLLYNAVLNVKKYLGIKKYGVRRLVQRFNSRPLAYAPLRKEFRQVLINEFKDDVRKLSAIINRDLSHWLH